MPPLVNVFVITMAIAVSAIFLYTSILPRTPFSTTNDQVNNQVQDYGIFKEVFLNPDFFLTNYALMEKGFKIFIYPNNDDELLFYNEKYMRGRFSTEAFFFYRFITSERFYTENDAEAHMFFIPLTRFQIRRTGIDANAENYVREIINEYPHWNRSRGGDHFLVTCFDEGAIFSERVPLHNSIRLSCSPGLDPKRNIYHKHLHITLPQMRLPFVPPVPGNDIPHRTILAFWACRENFPASAGAWENYSDTEKFKASKYCICDGESYVTRICITDSIHFGCVPVIFYENYELPFGDILDWTKFSVIISKDNANRVEQILEAIPDSRFSELHNNLLKVQRHFQSGSALEAIEGPKPYDVFHMIMYELWLRHGARAFSAIV